MTAELPQLISESQVLREANLADTKTHREFLRSKLPSTLAGGQLLYTLESAQHLAGAVAAARQKQKPTQAMQATA